MNAVVIGFLLLSLGRWLLRSRVSQTVAKLAVKGVALWSCLSWSGSVCQATCQVVYDAICWYGIGAKYLSTVLYWFLLKCTWWERLPFVFWTALMTFALAMSFIPMFVRPAKLNRKHVRFRRKMERRLRRRNRKLRPCPFWWYFRRSYPLKFRQRLEYWDPATLIRRLRAQEADEAKRDAARERRGKAFCCMYSDVFAEIADPPWSWHWVRSVRQWCLIPWSLFRGRLAGVRKWWLLSRLLFGVGSRSSGGKNWRSHPWSVFRCRAFKEKGKVRGTTRPRTSPDATTWYATETGFVSREPSRSRAGNPQHVLDEILAVSPLISSSDDGGTLLGLSRLEAMTSAVDDAQALANIQAMMFHSGAYVNATEGEKSQGQSSVTPPLTVVWDTGASCSVTPTKSDFKPGTYQPCANVVVQGLAQGSQIEGVGVVSWILSADDGTLRTFEHEAAYVPASRRRLLSPQSWIRQEAKRSGHRESFTVDDESFSLSGHPTLPPISGTLNANNKLPETSFQRLPETYCAPAGILHRSTQALASCVTETKNTNLLPSQKELLRWHFRLGHVAMSAVQKLLSLGRLAGTEQSKHLHTQAGKCELPKCASCQYGKQCRRPVPGRVSNQNPVREGALSADNVLPGQKVSVDHFICSTKGRLRHTRGKEAVGEMFVGGALFVDHASKAIFVKEQVTLTGHETLRAKHDFEKWLSNFGHVAQAYHTDNSTAFRNAEYTQDLLSNKQVTEFAGVGAHHHNGVAERAIRTIMAMARTMMLHAAIRWPECADAQLWPMAVQYAVHIHNRLPNPRTGLSPLDVLSGTKQSLDKLHDLHVFGCPAYVLDPRISDGKKIPKWQPRSRRGVFLGVSQQHSSSAPLILNMNTGSSSPQFHVIMDDWFSTTVSSEGAAVNFEEEPWSNLFLNSRFQYPFDEDHVPGLSEEWQDNAFYEDQQLRRDAIRVAREGQGTSSTSPASAPGLEHVATLRHGSSQREQAPVISAVSPVPVPSPLPVPSLPSPLDEPKSEPPEPKPQREREPSPIPAAEAEPPDTNESQPRRLRRSTRVRQPPKPIYVPEAWSSCIDFVDCVTRHEVVTHRATPEFVEAYAASLSDPDTLKWHEAIAAPDADEFYASAKAEIEELQKKKAWSVVPASKAAGKPITPLTWTFRRKRYPDGRIRKYKGRICFRGDLDPNPGESFAPVASWTSIRLLLYFSLVFQWKTRCIDFNNAFIQADLPEPKYVRLPKGFSDRDGREDVVLELHKSLYGLCEAPRLWHEHLKGALKKAGLKPSALDPCLWYGKSVMLAFWVDDVILISPKEEIMTQLCKRLEEAGLELTDEGELANFLGLTVEYNKEERSVTLSQKGLIQKILNQLDMRDCNRCATPAASSQLLSASKDSARHNAVWKYASAIGMLMYLSTNTRPDIAFAVHQAARFTHDPRAPHTEAVKRIVRYLKGTADKGLVLKPASDLAVDVYCDADFAGMYGAEDPNDPNSVKSRTGYVIMIGGCPLLWKSKLQSTIALSSTEAEYVSLSQAMREMLPLKELLKEMSVSMNFKRTYDMKAHSTIFEDNNGAVALARTPKMTPRSKHVAVVYHWFRQHVLAGTCFVEKCDTKDQVADIFTKPLPREAFEKLRDVLMGWNKQQRLVERESWATQPTGARHQIVTTS